MFAKEEQNIDEVPPIEPNIKNKYKNVLTNQPSPLGESS